MATRQRFVAGRTAASRAPLKLHTPAPEMTLLRTSWQEMDAAVAEAIAVTGRTAGTLRINTPGMAARKLISPRLGRYHRAHPDVVLDIVIDDGLSDIVAGRFDAGIRVGERLKKGHDCSSPRRPLRRCRLLWSRPASRDVRTGPHGHQAGTG
jgi:DNA-binding transcriptional LysR family regulator